MEEAARKGGYLMDALYLLAVMSLGIAVGIPIAYSMLLASLYFIVFTDNGMNVGILAQQITTANDSFPILAIPFFLLAGILMGHGGVSRRLFNVAIAWVGHLPGGIGIAAVLTAMFFSAISGSGPATVAAVGSIMIPQMVKFGYSKHFSAALIASAGTMGIVIPPSIPLVVYGVISGTSIGDLFLAAAIPGVIMGALLALWVLFHAKKHKIAGVDKASWPERLSSLNKAKGALLMPVIVLGGIYGGIFTPTEAAVIAVVYTAALSTLAYRELDFPGIFRALSSAAITTSALMIILASAAVFALMLTVGEGPAVVLRFMATISPSPTVIILLAAVLMLIIGTFMETLAAVTIVSPILVPLLVSAQMDPVQIGVVLIMLLALGFITPPLGVNLFIAAKTAGISSERTFVAALPGLGLLIGACLLAAFVPVLTLGLL
jgi:C4-dicarboxylate transporter DctM subunit